MVRTARFTAESFINAAMLLVAEGGPAAATMQAIARRVGAPTGSIYHRFESRSAVLGAAWNAAYGSFTGALSPALHTGKPREAALAILPWCVEDQARARFLLLHEPVALFDDTPPPVALRQQLDALEQAFDEAFLACITLCGGEAAREADLARAKFLIFDGPIAILRPSLAQGIAPSPWAARMISDLHAGMGLAAAPNARAA